MINLQLLGGLDVAGPDLSPEARVRRRHPLMLLALLASAAPQAVSRERLMAFLWPESDADRASNSLRQALHYIRKELGDDVFLPDTPSGIQLNPAAVAVDLWTFREAIARGTLADAVSAYRGPFLDGVLVAKAPELCRWVESERASVAHQLVAALDQLAREAEDSVRFDDAVTWRRRQAESDPYSSRAALGLLKALTAAGDRPGALAYATVYENFLRSHLEVEPDPAVLEFVAELRRPSPAKMIAVRDDAALAAPTSLRPTVAMRAIPLPLPASVRNPARRWMVVAGFVSIGLVGVGSTYSMVAHTAPDPVMVLGSGAYDESGRDTATMIVSCEGPACPAGPLPQPAYIVPRHAAYNDPAPGTRFISVAPDATTRDSGYVCCTTIVFERAFRLPPDAASATLTFSAGGDNRVTAFLNGNQIFEHPDSLLQWNFAGPPVPVTATFVPDPSGVNRLRVRLWDAGGVTALNFRALVQAERQELTRK